MKDNRFYYLLGFMRAILIAIVIIGCTSPLEAGGASCGDSEWNACWVRITE